jgi:DnaJ-class molecular chaperone
MLNEMFGNIFPESAERDPTRGSGRKGGERKEINVEIESSLEDLYHGRVRNLRIRDTVSGGGGVEKVFRVDIRPGFRDGTKVKYPASGGEGGFPRAVTFSVKEKKHKFFERRKNDLFWRCELTQRQVERGVVVKLPLFDGSVLQIVTSEHAVSDGFKLPFKGMGMPISKKSSTTGQIELVDRGDLIVKFRIISK